MTQQQQPPRIGGKGKAGIALGLAGAVALILANVFDLEGGYVDHPNDPGGATNHGITEQVARDHGYQGDMRDLQRNCPAQLEALVASRISGDGQAQVQEVCADAILFESYIAAPRFLDLIAIDPAVAEEVIDTGVNMGPARPSRFFQRAVNRVCNTTLDDDGRIGPITLRAWSDCRANLGPRSCVAMLDDLDRQQANEYDRLIRRNPRLRVFRRGWMNHRIGNVSRTFCYAPPTAVAGDR